MSTSLIKTALDANALENLIFESGGELNETIEAWMNEIGQNLATKADAYHFTMQKLEATAEMFTIRADENARVAKQLVSVITNMKERIKTAMTVMNTEEVKGSEIRFKLQNSPPALIIENESKLPAEFFTVETVTTLNRKYLSAALKEGREIDGAKLHSSKHLRTYMNKGDSK